MKIVAVLCMILAITYGQSTWSQAINGTWNSITGWGTGGIPTDSAIINAIGSFVVSINSPVTLITSLTLGGSGSLPTLFVNGSSLSVPALNLVSGTLLVVNGSVSVTGKILVNTNGTVIIDIASGTIQSILGGTEIAKGQLQLLGATALTDTYKIANGSALLLSGQHTAASCKFSGDGTVSLTGSLTLNNAADCEVDSNTFVLAGGFLNSTAASTAEFASLVVNGANSTIQGLQVEATAVSLVSGSLNIATTASLTVEESLTVSTSGIVTVMGQLNVLGQAAVNQGTLLLQSAVVYANTTVANGAQLAVNNTRLVAAYIRNAGTVTFNNAVAGLNSTANYVTVIGGQVYINSALTVQFGAAYFSNVTAQGAIAIQAGAKATLDNVMWTAGKINNTGNLILSNAIEYAGDLYYYATTQSASLSVTGAVTATDGSIFHFSGQGNVEGSYSNGTVSIEGSFATSAGVKVDGILQVIGGALSTAQGNIQTTKDIIVTKSGMLIASINSTAMNISTNANLIVNATSQVIVQGALSVGATIQLGAQSTLNVTKGYASALALTMDSASTYAVTVFSNTTSRVLNVVNNAQLSGSLEVDIDASFTFGIGQTQTVMTYGARTGTFGMFSIKRDPDSVNYGAKSATVTRGTDTSSSGMNSDASAFHVAILPLAFLAYFF
eukprot:TRINITY_DN794_c0_g1_i1.p1 TRINITY_DN794_c0_g1~~TRINITY_DN794_c0_g1_i1.p1  ORF type:complete len:669 (-),score=233.65 TRINITY_DN794_c0_g1_i1:62-2068(-)